MSVTNLVLSKQDQIQERRDVVLTWLSRGLNISEISSKVANYGVSRKTISRDVDYLKSQARQFVRDQQTNMAFEYQQVLSNFYQLRKMAWLKFSDDKNLVEERDKIAYFHIIEAINHDILHALAIGDMIETELLQSLKQDASDFEKALDEQEHGKDKQQAVF